jgi:hypothetical protein
MVRIGLLAPYESGAVPGEEAAMANASDSSDRATNWIRWIARGTGSLVAAYWLLIGIASALSEGSPWTLQSAMMAGFVIATVLAVLIAWWREAVGGTIAVICGVALSTFAYVTAGHSKVLAMLVSGGPLLVAGVLFLVSWWRSRRARTHQDSAC